MQRAVSCMGLGVPSLTGCLCGGVAFSWAVAAALLLRWHTPATQAAVSSLLGYVGIIAGLAVGVCREQNVQRRACADAYVASMIDRIALCGGVVQGSPGGGCTRERKCLSSLLGCCSLHPLPCVRLCKNSKKSLEPGPERSQAAVGGAGAAVTVAAITVVCVFACSVSMLLLM
jgi:hypothetical protein